MTTYTLLSATAPGNPSTPPPAVVPPATRGVFTFSITGPATNYAQATVLASDDSGQDLLPIKTLVILPNGPNTVTDMAQFGANYTIFDANLDNLAPGQGITATVTLTV